jgi:hypothetical protein
METSIRTLLWEKEIWPPSSPVCSPLDYLAWGVFELRVRAKSRTKSKDLIQKIKEVMGSLARDTVAKACMTFRSRIETSSQLMVVLLNM